MESNDLKLKIDLIGSLDNKIKFEEKDPTKHIQEEVLRLFDQSSSEDDKVNGCKYITTIASFIDINKNNIAQIKNVVEFTVRKIDDRSLQSVVANTLENLMKKIGRLSD